MNKFIIFILSLTLSFQAFAQRAVSENEPILKDQFDEVIVMDESSFFMPKIESPKKPALGPLIVAKSLDLQITQNDFKWYVDGNRAIAAKLYWIKEGQNINAIFENLSLPASAELYLIGVDDVLGPFDQSSFTDGSFSHFPLNGEQLSVHIECLPADTASVQLKMTQLNVRFDEEFKDGACNIPAICPDANPYRKAQKATVIINVNGFGLCTGTLMNNTSNDGTPYILTAQHCLNPSRNLSNWTFGFNVEAASCNNPDQNATGSFSLRGADVVAENGESDFALLRLREEIRPTDDVHFAGYDKSDISPQSQHVFHHPNGALKRFSLNEEPVAKTGYFGENNPPFVWHVEAWEKGTTEGGSSGSSLLTPSGLVIGNLVGGDAACNNTAGSDYYGRMAVSFQSRANAYDWIGPWLNPSYSTSDSLLGYDNPRQTPNIDLSITKISGIDPINCNNAFSPAVEIKNVGAQSVSNYTLNLEIVGQNNWTPNETITTIAPGASITYTFPERIVSNSGDVNFLVKLNVNGDEVPSNNMGTLPATILSGNNQTLTMAITLDDYGSENFWQVINQSGERVFSGGPYGDEQNGFKINEDFCLEPGCYTLEFIDTFGDGMCCEYGQGSFELRVKDTEETLVTGYDGPTNVNGESEKQITDFCVKAIGIEERIRTDQRVFPNPILPGAKLNFVQVEENTAIHISSSDGKQVFVGTAQNAKAPTTPGLYFLNMGSNVIKLVVQ